VFVSADSLNRQGADLHLRGDFEGARGCYVAALKMSPDYIPAMANLVDVLSQQNQIIAALSLSRKLTSAVPHSGDFWNMAGNLLMRLGRYGESEEALNKAAQLSPDNRSTWHNLGLLRYRQDRWEEAQECFLTTLKMGGDHKVQHDLAHAQMADGDLSLGLENYEIRWRTLSHLPPWDFHVKEWQGEDLQGKSLLLHAEQGYGDSIMTSRFVLDLRRLGASVTLGVPREMETLFQAQGWTVLPIEDMNQSNVGEFNFQSPMYSAMRHLGILKASIRPEPYLVPPLVTGPKPYPGAYNVGICWASGKRNRKFDWRRRVSPLEIWLPLAASRRQVQLWSLYPPGEDEIKQLGAESLVQHIEFEDWASTAAFIHQLDLVITVDTAVAHLAAALGKPTWMLSQFYHCWRWWDLEQGTGKPWYETMTIIRQTTPEGWEEQLDKCCEMLGHG
jgi:hypothetical protein